MNGLAPGLISRQHIKTSERAAGTAGHAVMPLNALQFNR